MPSFPPVMATEAPESLVIHGGAACGAEAGPGSLEPALGHPDDAVPVTLCPHWVDGGM